jgi:hypothetical protein
MQQQYKNMIVMLACGYDRWNDSLCRYTAIENFKNWMRANVPSPISCIYETPKNVNNQSIASFICKVLKILYPSEVNYTDTHSTQRSVIFILAA